MPSSDIAFTPAVKAVQSAKGSRRMFKERGDWRTEVDESLATFLAEAFSFYLATASADGQPYIQHRGGPPGSLRVLGPRRLGFADFAGNRQYLTVGNLSENPKACIFVMDYQHRRRVKLWGTARVIEDDPDLIRSLVVQGSRGRPERAILFDIEAWDTNCPQNIPQLVPLGPVARLIDAQDKRIAELEAELAALKGCAS